MGRHQLGTFVSQDAQLVDERRQFFKAQLGLEYVERGWYEIGWGRVEPEEINIIELDPP